MLKRNKQYSYILGYKHVGLYELMLGLEWECACGFDLCLLMKFQMHSGNT